MWKFLETSFPQLDLKQVLGGTGEVERFAESRGGTFPAPTITRGGAAFPVPRGSTSDGAGETAVVLVGDAMHHFPPDVGQGVNSALEDVMKLGDELARCGKAVGKEEGGEGSSSLADAVRSYERERRGESKALRRIVQVANPYQYSQPGLISVLRKAGWGLSFVLRRLLARLPVVGDEKGLNV